mmetsp:Transcript_37900/g.68530  ORF Transcript_37900/g.68530 Transcript_37900/m.68530 type:complete len:208 (+) Transcript_37900:2844-3467(+)
MRCIQFAFACVGVVFPLALVCSTVCPPLDSLSLTQEGVRELRMVLNRSVVEADPLLGVCHSTVFDHLFPHLKVERHHGHLQGFKARIGLPFRVETFPKLIPLLAGLKLLVDLEAHSPLFFQTYLPSTFYSDLPDVIQWHQELHHTLIDIRRVISRDGNQLCQRDAFTHLNIKLGKELVCLLLGVLVLLCKRGKLVHAVFDGVCKFEP